jgi:hypothetical protein
VRYIIEDGSVASKGSVDDIPESEYPDEQAQAVADEFTRFSWSCDFIKYKHSDNWYCIDMGLHGLYYDGSIHNPYNMKNWTAISEHPNKEESLHQYRDQMPTARELYKRR